MTIREQFQRVYRRIQRWAVGGVIVLACLVTWRYPDLTRLQNLGISVLLGVAILVILALLLRRRFLCPRCGTDLGKLRRQEVRQERRARGWFNVPMRLFWDVWDACPHCKVSLDDPYRNPLR
jgi:hypothetical protein